MKLGQTITTWGFSQVLSDKWITTVVNPLFQRIETGKKRRMNEQKWKFRSISLVKVDKFQMCKKFCSLFNENIVSLFSRGGPVCPLAVQVNSVEAIIDDECPWRGWRFLQFGSIENNKSENKIWGQPICTIQLQCNFLLNNGKKTSNWCNII